MLSEKESSVLDLVDDNKEEIIEYLRKLISFKTITPPSNGKAESDDYKGLQDFIHQSLREMGFTLDMWEIDASNLKASLAQESFQTGTSVICQLSWESLKVREVENP